MAHEFFKMLKKDHEQVKGILEQIEQTTERAQQSREKLLEQFKTAITPHMMGEEKYFYPLLKQDKETTEMALEAFEEHRVAKVQLQEIERTSFDDKYWKPKVTVLKDLLEHHIEVEEDEIFDKAEDILDKQQLDGLVMKFQQEKQNFMGQREKVTQRKM